MKASTYILDLWPGLVIGLVILATAALAGATAGPACIPSGIDVACLQTQVGEETILRCIDSTGEEFSVFRGTST